MHYKTNINKINLKKKKGYLTHINLTDNGKKLYEKRNSGKKKGDDALSFQRGRNDVQGYFYLLY